MVFVWYGGGWHENCYVILVMGKSLAEIEDLKNEREVLKKYEYLRNPLAIIRLKELRKTLKEHYKKQYGK